MDRGAHFHNCDFQVHSWRDENWTGAKPIDANGRFGLAKALIAKCREKGLNAIAITDHHDICSIKYIQLAAQEGSLEVSPQNDVQEVPRPPRFPSDFNPDPARQKPIVFPGMELSLQVPCQAIVLLDSHADIQLQEALVHLLGLVPMHAEESATGPQVVKLPITSLADLDKILRSNPVMNGRYIILPNLNYGGGDSLLRDGFHHHYSGMPCVGGYTEKDLSKAPAGHLNKLNGGDHNYGNKAVGMFQTSDCRSEDRKKLACRTTWVKFAEPTAEALRQACLAWDSRLFQTEPSLPRRFISRVEVTTSAYLGAQDVNLNPQFNAMIGGRGTGKSSFLEYIRWAMQDQPLSPATENAVDRRRHHFLETLKEVGGLVRVHWVVDETPHVVTFDPSKVYLSLKVAKGVERKATPEEIRDLLPIRAYSQKQLSSVSGRRGELQRFVEEPIRDRLRQFENDFETIRADIRKHYGNRRRRTDLTFELNLQQVRLSSTQERIRSIQSSLTNLPSYAEAALKEHTSRLEELTFITDVNERASSLLREITSIGSQFDTDDRVSLPDRGPQALLLSEIQAKIANIVYKLKYNIRNAKQEFESGLKEIQSEITRWEADQVRHNAVLSSAEVQQNENRIALEQLKHLREDEAGITSEIARITRLLKDCPDVTEPLSQAWNTWMGIHGERSQVLAEECNKLSRASGGKLEVELRPGHDAGQAIRMLEERFQGARISSNRWDALKAWLSEGGLVVQRWRALCEELLNLIESRDTVPALLLPSWELTDSMRTWIKENLTTDSWLDLSTLTIQDVPEFYYTGGGTRLAFEKASAGQQATVLLTLLLRDDNGPLIIDQPEDDLDSEIISDIIQGILKAKQVRQLIFASHNANLVVNGDAELVIKFKSVMHEGRSIGKIEYQGSIDCKPVREAITEVMEGGRKAFDLRRQKYGF
jgi:chromosome segregation protein